MNKSIGVKFSILNGKKQEFHFEAPYDDTKNDSENCNTVIQTLATKVQAGETLPGMLSRGDSEVFTLLNTKVIEGLILDTIGVYEPQNGK